MSEGQTNVERSSFFAVRAHGDAETGLEEHLQVGLGLVAAALADLADRQVRLAQKGADAREAVVLDLVQQGVPPRRAEAESAAALPMVGDALTEATAKKVLAELLEVQ